MRIDDNDLVGEVFKALDAAKNAMALLPPPPASVKPCFLRMLNAFYRIRDDKGSSRVSDINKAMGGQLPNTTKTINEMADLGIVEKFSLETDKRVVLVRTTALGEEYIDKYIVGFHKDFDKALARFDRDDLHTMISTLYDISGIIENIRTQE